MYVYHIELYMITYVCYHIEFNGLPWIKIIMLDISTYFIY